MKVYYPLTYKTLYPSLKLVHFKELSSVFRNWILLISLRIIEWSQSLGQHLDRVTTIWISVCLILMKKLRIDCFNASILFFQGRIEPHPGFLLLHPIFQRSQTPSKVSGPGGFSRRSCAVCSRNNAGIRGSSSSPSPRSTWVLRPRPSDWQLAPVTLSWSSERLNYFYCHEDIHSRALHISIFLFYS